jgi:hypothetical protein
MNANKKVFISVYSRSFAAKTYLQSAVKILNS